MITRITRYLLYLFVFSAIFYCKPDERSILPKISGSAGEVLLIIDNQKWESTVGEKFNEVLTQVQPALPQPEPVFKLIHTSPAGFTNIFRVHRNIIFARIGSEFEESKIAIQRDQWATPQLVINVQAPNDEECIRLLEESGDQIIERINRSERERLMDYYRSYQVAAIYNRLKVKHHLTLSIPKGYEIAVDTTDFVWISTESAQPGESGYAFYSQQSILIYYYDYVDTNTFTLDYLVNKRNQYLKKHIPGPNPGSYMATEDLLPPIMKEFKLDDRYVAELRGLWKLENGAMGGPFVSLSTVDEERNRVITVEGFVFAAGLDKREFLRQVESILYTLEIDEE
jgi:hypothetical protein